MPHPSIFDHRIVERATVDAVKQLLLRQSLATSIWENENFDAFAEDPRVYSGYVSDSVYSLLTQSTLPQETNISNCLAALTATVYGLGIEPEVARPGLAQLPRQRSQRLSGAHFEQNPIRLAE